ncbi:MAG: hypothetical protein EOP84_32065 [Verrucomicrobiaceae bacterium]|nr:MAG: hypothetical protein EOP84_32065 [Verrucomicrobiaceae bacterium]
MNAKQVLEIFVEQGIVDPSQVDDLAQEVNQTGKSLVETMVDYQFLTEQQFYQTIADSPSAIALATVTRSLYPAKGSLVVGDFDRSRCR